MSFGYTIGDRLFFSLCHWAILFFLVKIRLRARKFFSKDSKPPPPPPEYQMDRALMLDLCLLMWLLIRISLRHVMPFYWHVKSPDSKTMLGQRWHMVVRLAYGWVGSTTLAHYCPYVNILSLAVGSITSWNQYLDPTLGQCTPMACFNMTELRWVHYYGPTLAHSNMCTLTHCWLKGIGPTLFLLIGL